MEIIPIPADPSREDLRGARELLKGLAAVNVAGAAEQLKTVQAFIQRRYPRIADPKTTLERKTRPNAVRSGPYPIGTHVEHSIRLLRELSRV